MWWRSQILLLAFALSTALCWPAVDDSLARAAVNSNSAQSGVVLAKLSSPVYPPLARRIWVTGDVNLLLQIRRDGSVESVVLVSGHPLLQQAALDSAQQSQFECQGCKEAVTPYSLVYTFQLFSPDCHAITGSPPANVQQAARPHAEVSQSQNHIRVLDEGGICEGVFTHKVRSAKCLYLWRCGWHS